MALNTQITQTALDFRGLAELRHAAGGDEAQKQETLKQVASQFESLFINMMLKSMREAKLAEGLFESNQSNMYQDMADQQMAIEMSANGGLGLQDVIMRQLGGQAEMPSFERAGAFGKPAESYSIDSVEVRKKLEPIQYSNLRTLVKETTPEFTPEDIEQNTAFQSPTDFVERLWPMAKRAADKIGVEPQVILAQAALETGWGKHVISHNDGRSSYNLFNIKADASWAGEHAEKNAIEYRDGLALKEQSRFRSYESYQQSFDDYVDFLQTQPRYQSALRHSGSAESFVEELHKAGYATDPEYSNKIKRIMGSDTLAQISQELKYS